MRKYDNFLHQLDALSLKSSKRVMEQNETPLGTLTVTTSSSVSSGGQGYIYPAGTTLGPIGVAGPVGNPGLPGTNSSGNSYYQPIYQPTIQKNLNFINFMTDCIQLINEENSLRYYTPSIHGTIVLALDTHKFYQAEVINSDYMQPISTSIDLNSNGYTVRWREILINTTDGSLTKFGYLTTKEEEEIKQEELNNSTRSKAEVDDIFQEFEKNIKVKLTDNYNQKEQNHTDTKEYPPDISGDKVSAYIKTDY